MYGKPGLCPALSDDQVQELVDDFHSMTRERDKLLKPVADVFSGGNMSTALPKLLQAKGSIKRGLTMTQVIEERAQSLIIELQRRIAEEGQSNGNAE